MNTERTSLLLKTPKEPSCIHWGREPKRRLGNAILLHVVAIVFSGGGTIATALLHNVGLSYALLSITCMIIGDLLYTVWDAR